jgi:hypothetical protein
MEYALSSTGMNTSIQFMMILIKPNSIFNMAMRTVLLPFLFLIFGSDIEQQLQ